MGPASTILICAGLGRLVRNYLLLCNPGEGDACALLHIPSKTSGSGLSEQTGATRGCPVCKVWIWHNFCPSPITFLLAHDPALLPNLERPSPHNPPCLPQTLCWPMKVSLCFHPTEPEAIGGRSSTHLTSPAIMQTSHADSMFVTTSGQRKGLKST